MADDPAEVPSSSLIGRGGEGDRHLRLPLGNRHGLVTGAAGSGKAAGGALGVSR